MKAAIVNGATGAVGQLAVRIARQLGAGKALRRVVGPRRCGRRRLLAQT
jgi:NADPH:quinone reductase-like Zn-dependent oxidoreductase